MVVPNRTFTFALALALALALAFALTTLTRFASSRTIAVFVDVVAVRF